MGLWPDLLGRAGQTIVSRANYVKSCGRDFAAHRPRAVAEMIEAAGFTPPAPIFQAALIRGWAVAKG